MKTPALLTASAFALTLGTGTSAQLAGEINIAGSSTVGPITSAVAETFQEEYPSVSVPVDEIGTGGGFKRFKVGETDISNASRPIKPAEYAEATANGVSFVEVPVAYDGLTIVVNKSNDWADTLTVDHLKQIFLAGSTVDSWNDLDASFPDVPLNIYMPGTDSGTFDYFKEVVAGKAGSITEDAQVSENDNVLVNGVVGDRGGIGFFGCAYFFANEDKLKAVAIVNDAGDAVLPEAEAIESGAYNPFSRPLFVYVNTESLNRPEVAAFVDFYLDFAPEVSEEVGYVRLPNAVYAKAKQKIKDRETGTVFTDEDGNKVEGSITELY